LISPLQTLTVLTILYYIVDGWKENESKHEICLVLACHGIGYRQRSCDRNSNSFLNNSLNLRSETKNYSPIVL
jgi:hypothetical protein